MRSLADIENDRMDRKVRDALELLKGERSRVVIAVVRAVIEHHARDFYPYRRQIITTLAKDMIAVTPREFRAGEARGLWDALVN